MRAYATAISSATFLFAAALPPLALAQLGRASNEELLRNGNGPGPVPGGVSASSLIAIADVPPPADRHDFAGTWRIARLPGQAPAAAAAAANRPAEGLPASAVPGAVPGALPGALPEGAPPQSRAGKPGQLPDGILCMPMPGTTVGVDGPMRIIQSGDLIYWVAEQAHTVRRIWLNAQHTPQFKPNHLGEAVGYFEGDTLVVETAGLKRLPVGAKLVERWSKSSDGKQVDMTLQDLDASGKPLGNLRKQSITWRPGEQVMEWMCEDYNDEWLPGGTDFEDQVAK